MDHLSKRHIVLVRCFTVVRNYFNEKIFTSEINIKQNNLKISWIICDVSVSVQLIICGGGVVFIMILAALIYICLPWYFQTTVWVVNLFMPDPIPFLDEIIMFVPIAYKIKRIFDLSEFLRKYGKILAIMLGVGVVVFILCLIFF